MAGDNAMRELPPRSKAQPERARLLDVQAQQVWFWLALLVAVLSALALFKDILLPFVSGMMLAYFLNPLAERLEALGLSRPLAATLIVGLVGAALVVGLVLLAPIIAAQVEQLIKSLPADVDRARRVLEQMAQQRLGSYFATVQAGLDRAAAEIQNNASGLFTTLASALWSRSSALINVLSLVLITPLVVFYLLVDWHPMMARVQLWLPRDHIATIESLASQINDAIAAFVRGQGAICLCLGLFYAVALSVVGLNYSIVVGLVTGLMAFVPMVGWIVGSAVAIVIALVQFAPKFAPVLGVLGVMVGGMALDTAVLSPRLVGKKVGLHPVWLIFALLAFSYLFGIVGTLVAVPVSAALAVLARFAVARYLDSDVYLGRDRVDGPTPGGPPR